MPQEIPACYYRVSIKALIFDETKTKFLIGLTKNGKWTIPGGGLDWGEDYEQCLKRELLEEAGLEVVSINPKPTFVLPGKREENKWYVNILHEVVVKDFNITPTAECLEIRFVTPAEAKALTSYIGVQHLAEALE